MGDTRTQRCTSVIATSALLFLLPLATYWRTIFHRYGIRDDYSILREVQEEPGKVLRVCAMIGRPLYGWLLELSGRAAGGIDGLCWLRFASAACLGVLGSVVFLLLKQQGWRPPQAALLAATLTMLPSAQVLASWAICWPQALASLLGAAAFALSDWEEHRTPGVLPRGSGWILAVCVMAVATLTYQPSGLFYAVLVAASLVARRHDSFRSTLVGLARHLGVMGAGLGAAFVFMKLLFATGMFQPSPRLSFELHWLNKAAWVMTHALPHTLALLVLDDTRGGTPAAFRLMVGLTLVTITVGLVLEGRRAGLAGCGRWLVGLAALSAAAYCVSFLAHERWPTYRTLYALTGVWSVFFVASLVNIGACWPAGGQKVATALLACLAAASVVLAHRQSFELFALPQGRELALMEEGASRAVLAERPRIFVITVLQDDTSAPRRYLDEFGSVSIDAEWMAKEVLKHVMKERFPEVRDVSGGYRFATGPRAPEPGDYDILIDLRRLRQGT
ncbi:hypothetical protein JRI60_08640 [Archangium violaceum]|uniref:hypothetical protein n=1 Tax=Archangium violaceum TaxID=83451 RepID=UPI00195289C4|nr:hypothetical protein [Archangium violaceum]QRN99071.1 hypothetical protein JRI60_08640 [Archangium violaceum]